MHQLYESKFEASIDNLISEGRYRSFANLQRECGNFPNATYRPQGFGYANVSEEEAESLKFDVSIFCSNDYLGMGQHPKVLKAAKESID